MTEMWSGPWIHSPFFEDVLNQKNLSQEDEKLVREFHATGFIALPGLIDAEAADTLIDEMRPHYETIQGRQQDLWMKCAQVRALAVNEKIKSMLKLLYGRVPIPFQTLNFKYGTEQRTHSDFIHFSSLPEGFMCGVWVALEDINESNGPLHYYPGSHDLPLYDYYQIGSSGPITDYQDYEEFISRVAAASRYPRVELKAKKGDAFIWAANLLHGGNQILAHDSTRWSQVTHYYFENCIYYTPMLSNRISGELFLRTPTHIETLQKIESTYNGLPLSICTPPECASRIGFGPNSTPPLWLGDLFKPIEPLEPPKARGNWLSRMLSP